MCKWIELKQALCEINVCFHFNDSCLFTQFTTNWNKPIMTWAHSNDPSCRDGESCVNSVNYVNSELCDYRRVVKFRVFINFIKLKKSLGHVQAGLGYRNTTPLTGCDFSSRQNHTNKENVMTAMITSPDYYQCGFIKIMCTLYFIKKKKLNSDKNRQNFVCKYLLENKCTWRRITSLIHQVELLVFF